jgi:hypothetical protein
MSDEIQQHHLHRRSILYVRHDPPGSAQSGEPSILLR